MSFLLKDARGKLDMIISMKKEKKDALFPFVVWMMYAEIIFRNTLKQEVDVTILEKCHE